MTEKIQIPEGLPRFDDEKAFIIICGGMEARVLSGENGILSDVFRLKGPEIHYSDKETRFTTNAGGRSLGMGSVLEQVGEKEKSEFFVELERKMSETIGGGFSGKIYVLVPKFAASRTIESIPLSARGSVIIAADGNYLDKSLVEILEIVSGKEA